MPTSALYERRHRRRCHCDGQSQHSERAVLQRTRPNDEAHITAPSTVPSHSCRHAGHCCERSTVLAVITAADAESAGSAGLDTCSIDRFLCGWATYHFHLWSAPVRLGLRSACRHTNQRHVYTLCNNHMLDALNYVQNRTVRDTCYWQHDITISVSKVARLTGVAHPTVWYFSWDKKGCRQYDNSCSSS